MSLFEVYAEFDVFCMIIMIMLTVKTHTLAQSLRYQKLYLLLMTCAMLLVSSDFVYEAHCAGKFFLGEFWLYFVNILYFVSCTMISYIWFVYTRFIMESKRMAVKRARIFAAMPALVSVLLAFSTFYTKWFFYFDEEGYHRGKLNFISMVIPLLYFVGACLMAFVRYRMEPTKSNKEKLFTVLTFAVIPIISVAVQVIFVGYPVVCIGAMLGMLQTFMNNIAAEREQLLVQETATRSKNDFFAGMSHEIRTPINAIIGMNTMILRESDDETIKGYASGVDNSGKLLLALVNDILDISKIEAGKMKLIPVEYHISEMLMDVVGMVKSKAAEKNLKLITDIDASIPSVFLGDEVRMRQIILNIMNNAVKYTNEGSVTLTVRCNEIKGKRAALFFSVKDTGQGMKKEDLQNLFSPYERVDENRNRKVEGTGLGMSITKQLLELMDSQIEVESTYGEGSNFFFTVWQNVINDTPIGTWEEEKVTYKKKEKYVPTFQAPGARILAVDDTVINLRVFKALLKQTQIQIDTATSGAEALHLVRDNKYDMIFIDIMMPQMDGVETLQAMNAEDNHVTSDVPIIALTANALSGAKEEYLSEGFTDYLSKPVEAVKLEAMILEYLPKNKLS